MKSGGYGWLTVGQAAARFGYRQAESLRRRIRQLRERGYVVDQGNPPVAYQGSVDTTRGKIVLFWPNRQIMLIRSDAPRALLTPGRGRRPTNSNRNS